ncbi:hypothetical protein [Pendulispora albinea]|uniref:Right handed beta helix domain-containing protein n=1 Tax=Pendulispora albinea TaxID=2741071 RepID=A0ABZ2LSM9_9BACT
MKWVGWIAPVLLLVPVSCSTGNASGSSDGGYSERNDGGSNTDASADGPSPAGWELTTSNTGLARIGLECARLPLYAGPSKPPAGTIITEKRIATGLDLSAGNIVVERSCIRPTTIAKGLPVVTTTDNDACRGDDCPAAPTMVVIRDSEIDGTAVASATIAYSCAFLGIGTLERNDIHDVGSGICFFNTGDHLDAVARGNYVHHLRATGDPASTGSHNEGITIRDFETRLHPERRAIIRNNRFDSSSGNDTAAFFIQTYGGDIDQVLLQGNLLEGQGYQLVLEAGFNHVYGRALNAIDNRFSGTGYGIGYVERKGLPYGWALWQDNAMHDPAKPAHRGQLVASP